MAENAGKAHTGLALDPRIGCAEQREKEKEGTYHDHRDIVQSPSLHRRHARRERRRGPGACRLRAAGNAHGRNGRRRAGGRRRRGQCPCRKHPHLRRSRLAGRSARHHRRRLRRDRRLRGARHRRRLLGPRGCELRRHGGSQDPAHREVRQGNGPARLGHRRRGLAQAAGSRRQHRPAGDLQRSGALLPEQRQHGSVPAVGRALRRGCELVLRSDRRRGSVQDRPGVEHARRRDALQVLAHGSWRHAGQRQGRQGRGQRRGRHLRPGGGQFPGPAQRRAALPDEPGMPHQGRR